MDKTQRKIALVCLILSILYVVFGFLFRRLMDGPLEVNLTSLIKRTSVPCDDGHLSNKCYEFDPKGTVLHIKAPRGSRTYPSGYKYISSMHLEFDYEDGMFLEKSRWPIIGSRKKELKRYFRWFNPTVELIARSPSWGGIQYTLDEKVKWSGRKELGQYRLQKGLSDIYDVYDADACVTQKAGQLVDFKNGYDNRCSVIPVIYVHRQYKDAFVECLRDSVGANGRPFVHACMVHSQATPNVLAKYVVLGPIAYDESWISVDMQLANYIESLRVKD